MKTLRSVAELRAELADARDVGLVPTMGAFHEGHLSLFRAARAENELLVAAARIGTTRLIDNVLLEGELP